jgi:hypothetical protein
MVTRLAIVLWWFGTLVGLACIAAPWVVAFTSDRCTTAHGVNVARADAIARSIARTTAEDACKRMQPREEPFYMPPQGTPEWDRAQAKLAGVQDQAARADECLMKLPARVAIPDAADDSRCPSMGYRAIAAGVGILVTLAFWAICFVLRGAFWRPPRSST